MIDVDRIRVRVRLGETFTAEEVDELLDEIAALERSAAMAFQFGYEPDEED